MMKEFLFLTTKLLLFPLVSSSEFFSTFSNNVNETSIDNNLSFTSDTNQFGLNEIQFNTIIESELPENILLSPYNQLSFQSNSDKAHWLQNKQLEATNGDPHAVVVCDTDISRTGGQRKAYLIAQGYSKESIATVLSSVEKSCFIIYAKDQEISRMPDSYSILPMSYVMKIRSQTVSRVTSSTRSSALEISALIFFQNKRSEYSASTTPSYENKILSFTRNEVLTSSYFTANRGNNEKFFSDDDDDAKTDQITSICSASYDQLQFLYSDAVPETNLLKMSITSTEMERFIASKIDTENLKVPKNELFQDCLLSLVGSMSLLPEVVSIEVKPEYRVLNDQIQYLIQSFTKKEYPWYEVGLTGKGEVIAHSDSGIDLNNCYFWDSSDTLKKGLHEIDLNQRKVVQYDPFADDTDFLAGHGTHVAGTIAGHRAINGIDQDKGIANGIAFDAKIAFIDIGLGENVTTPPTERLLGTGQPYAKIHSASWGSEDLVNSAYDIQALEIDNYLYLHDDFLFVVAAGNFGGENLFGSVSSPGVAKNVLTVGATDSYGPDITASMKGPSYVAGFSSKGPTVDGRTKPDILAPGYFVLSAGAQPDIVGACDPADGVYPRAGFDIKDGVASNAGTSMSTPAVSGALAMIRQYFRDGFYPSGERCPDASMEPSNALMKAVILNGGQPLRGVDNKGYTEYYPQHVFPSVPYDNIQNYGRVSLEDTLYIKDKSDMKSIVYDRQTVMESETKCASVTVDHSDWCQSDSFSVTLVWMDKPGFQDCSEKCLMNDLDLYVIKNNNEHRKYYPNGLSVRDDKNTAERVRIEGLDHGDTLDIYVRGTNFEAIEDVQQYALAITGCVIEGYIYSDNHDSYDDKYGKKSYYERYREGAKI